MEVDPAALFFYASVHPRLLHLVEDIVWINNEIHVTYTTEQRIRYKITYITEELVYISVRARFLDGKQVSNTKEPKPSLRFYNALYHLLHTRKILAVKPVRETILYGWGEYTWEVN